MKRIRIDLGRKNNSFINDLKHQIPLASYAAVILLSLFIASPFTSRISDRFDFDLRIKDDDYQAKTYILEMDLDKNDKRAENTKVTELKDIIQKRLDRYGVEVVMIEDHEVEKAEDEIENTEVEEVSLNVEAGLTEDTLTVGHEVDLQSTDSEDTDIINRNVKVTVETTKEMTFVDRLVLSRNDLVIVTPKEDVDFDDPEQPLAIYLPENYERTEFTRASFRNILVRELPTASGETAYFALYKMSPTRQRAFLDLMHEYAGEAIGIETDGFVMPYQVPREFDKELYGTQGIRPDFAPAVGQDPEDAKVSSILFNSGIISTEYRSIEQIQDVEISRLNLDNPTVFFAVLGSMLGIFILISILHKDQLSAALVFTISTVTTYALWLVYLKYTFTSVDLDLLILTAFMSISILSILIFIEDRYHIIKGVYLTSVILLVFLSAGLLKLYLSHVLVLSIIAYLNVYTTRWFLDKFRDIMQK